MDLRSLLDKNISPKDFVEFYWLKKELVAFCRTEGLKQSGGKIAIANRIENYLRTGTRDSSKTKSKSTQQSSFDWNIEQLTADTVITDNYKNAGNVRRFFENQIGPQFKFNLKFMNWMKTNVDKTLQDAILEWRRLTVEKKTKTQSKEIAPQFEFNRYLRDFLVDNPDQSRKNGIALWKIKRSMRGDNIYRKEDLDLFE